MKFSGSRRVLLAFVLLLFVIASVYGGKTATLPMKSKDWVVDAFDASGDGTSYSPGALPHNGGVYFYFPVDSGGITRLLYRYAKPYANHNVPITGSSFTATFEVVTTGNPIFNYMLEPSNTCVNPAHVRFYMDRQRWWEPPYPPTYRWFSNPVAFELVGTSSTVRLTVPLDPAQWMSVYGVYGNDALADFQGTLDDSFEIGFSFGGGCYLGHGVNGSGGTATFVLSNFTIG